MPRKSRMAASNAPSLRLRQAKNTSSKTKGAHRAAANGQPTTPPMANHSMPQDVLMPPRQFMKDAAPTIAKYIAKLDGRYAVLAWKFPGLRTVAMMKKIPIRGLIVVLTTRKSRVWQKAQEKARTYRTK